MYESTFDILVDVMSSALSQSQSCDDKCRVLCVQKLFEALRTLLEGQHKGRARARLLESFNGSLLYRIPTHLLHDILARVDDGASHRLVCREFAAAGLQRSTMLRVNLDKLSSCYSQHDSAGSNYNIRKLLAFAEFITRPTVRHMVAHLRMFTGNGACDNAHYVVPLLGLVSEHLRLVDLDFWMDDIIAENLAFLLRSIPSSSLRSLRCRFVSSEDMATVASACPHLGLQELCVELHTGMEPAEDVAVTSRLVASISQTLLSLQMTGCTLSWMSAFRDLRALTSLQLHGIEMKTARWQQLFDALHELRSLGSLEVTDCCQFEGTVFLNDGGLGSLRSLTRLVVSFNDDMYNDDAIGFEVQGPSALPLGIEYLELQNVQCVGDNWGQAIARLCKLRVLDMEYNCLRTGSFDLPRTLEGLPWLERLRFVTNPVGAHRVAALSSSLLRLARLVDLDLSESLLCSGAVAAIAPYLVQCGKHVQVRLEDNDLAGDRAAEMFSLVLLKREPPEATWHLGSDISSDVSSFVLTSLKAIYPAWGRHVLRWGQ